MGHFRRIADWAGNVSTAQWAWSVAGGTVTTLAAWLADQPPHLVLFYGAAAFALVMIAVHRLQLILQIKERQRAVETASPIVIESKPFIDFDSMVDEQGKAVEGIYSFALCVIVSNGLPDGEVLRNLSARLHYFYGEAIPLPVRGALDTKIDVRHGEYAIFEVGRFPHKPPGSSLPGMPRAGQNKQTIPDDFALQTEEQWQKYRRLVIAGADGVKRHYGFLDHASDPGTISVTFSADGVVSETVLLRLNLFAPDGQDWIEVMPKEH